MKDKYGHIIIPGDIVEGTIETVGGPVLCWHHVIPGDEMEGWRDYEIIGNIRDNPEKLKDWRMM